MSTQNQGGGAPTRGYRRRKAMLDLNAPPNESREHEGTSNVVVPQPQDVQLRVHPAPIDVEVLDDDVVESSPRAFAQAKHNAQRAHGRPFVVDLDSGRTTRMNQNNRYKRRRVQSNQTIINCDLYINLEGSSSSSTAIGQKERSHVPPKSPTLPPKDPTFNCPICMGQLVEPTSTKCGHIFCKGCIKTAIAAQAKCPTCRKRVTVKELIRVFLPATS